MSRLIRPPKKLLASVALLSPMIALAGCGSPAGAAPADPRTGPATSTVATLAAAADLEHLNALAIIDGYVYFTGGGTLVVPADAPPGSDTFGVLRRVPESGGTVEELWKGQGIGYAVARHTGGIAFVTYDYASRGRTGVVRVLRPDRTVEEIGTWRAHGSCVGLAARDGAVYWIHSAGSSGVVNRTDGGGTTSTLAGTGACPGKPHVRGERLFWLAGTSLLQAATSSLAAGTLWQARQSGDRQSLDAIATHDAAPELVLADYDELVAIDPATGRTRVLGTGYHGTTDLAFDGAGLRVFDTNVGGTVSATSLADGRRVVVATSQSQPKGIAAGDRAIYWIDGGARAVMTAQP